MLRVGAWGVNLRISTPVKISVENYVEKVENFSTVKCEKRKFNFSAVETFTQREARGQKQEARAEAFNLASCI